MMRALTSFSALVCFSIMLASCDGKTYIERETGICHARDMDAVQYYNYPTQSYGVHCVDR